MTPAEERHRELLEKWRGALDLVGPGPLQPHFDDAAAAVGSWLDARGRWADLGSGAGFPGVALAARHPEARVELVESRQKRSVFLAEVIAGSGLANLSLVQGRVEALPSGVYEGVVARAYKPPAAFLADAARLLVPGGTAVVLLARGAVPEVDGFTVFHVERYRVDDRERRAVAMRWGGAG